MKEEQIKLAFSKVKQDIDNLNQEISKLKNLIKPLLNALNTSKLHELARNQTSTVRQINATDSVTSTHNTTVPQEIGGLKYPNLSTSIGNQGASTDRQTDRQTDTSTHIYIEKPQKSIETNILEASEILESLDQIKKQIRLKFKRITNQEMAVFSTIYQLDEQNPEQNTYNNLAKILKLSQSSIRDYVQRMMNKGIPIRKTKINNKKILLSISPKLKKIATLSTIIQLRGL